LPLPEKATASTEATFIALATSSSVAPFAAPANKNGMAAAVANTKPNCLT